MSMQLPKAFPENSTFQNLKKFKPSPILYMQEVADKYGSPVDLNLPMGKFVLVSDPEQAYQVLVTNSDKYEKSKGYREIARVLGNGMLTAEGEQWHHQRKALQPSFHKTELRKLIPAVWNTADAYLNKLNANTVLRLDTELSGLTLTILLNSLINMYDEELVDKMSNHIMFGQDFIVNRIRSPFKWPVWVPTKENRAYHKMMQEANDLIQKSVNERRKISESEIDDILSVLMKTYDPDAEFEKIRDELLTFLVAGHETSALGMTWTLHLLAHHPEIQEKLFQEVEAIEKLEDIDFMNFSNLDYTQKVIKESLRYYPPIWNIVRRAKEDNVVNGVAIIKDQQLMINILQLHHNPEYWENPSDFNPERFSKSLSELNHKFQYIPFGAGSRFCIGNNFAIYEMMILLIQFIKRYEIKPKTEQFIGYNPLLTLRPDRPVEVKLVSRK